MVKKIQPTISSLGDSAFVIDYEPVIDEAVNRKVLAVSNAIKEANIVGIKDIVPAYSSITVHYNVVTVLKKHSGGSAFATIKKQLEAILFQPTKGLKEVTRHFRIPVCYAAKYALDSGEIAAHLNLSFEKIIQLHTSKTYRVYMVGFLPGFAYMGEVDEQIAVPRKQAPRLNIEEGCVGIAGKQTGIYPLASPGGWQIIGKTPIKLFDKYNDRPVLFQAGDEVEFYSITADEFDNY